MSLGAWPGDPDDRSRPRPPADPGTPGPGAGRPESGPHGLSHPRRHRRRTGARGADRPGDDGVDQLPVPGQRTARRPPCRRLPLAARPRHGTRPLGHPLRHRRPRRTRPPAAGRPARLADPPGHPRCARPGRHRAASQPVTARRGVRGHPRLSAGRHRRRGVRGGRPDRPRPAERGLSSAAGRPRRGGDGGLGRERPAPRSAARSAARPAAGAPDACRPARQPVRGGRPGRDGGDGGPGRRRCAAGRHRAGLARRRDPGLLPASGPDLVGAARGPAARDRAGAQCGGMGGGVRARPRIRPRYGGDRNAPRPVRGSRAALVPPRRDRPRAGARNPAELVGGPGAGGGGARGRDVRRSPRRCRTAP